MFHMEHKIAKDYKLEIVCEILSKGENYVRGIAKNIGTNHMTVSRKVKELVKENILNYKEEGRNKTYFLKKTIESRNSVFSAENYKFNKALAKYPVLRGIAEKIQKDKRIKLAVLFGSYAKGIAKHDSDIDLYIDSLNRKLKEEIGIIDSKINVKIGEYDKQSLLIREIEKNHVILKGVEEYYEKNRFFE